MKLGLTTEQLEFLGPEYWDKLCIRYPGAIDDRFDYRIPLSKARVVQAFQNQRYFPKYIAQYSSELDKSELVVRIKNNRTPLVLEIPFSPNLTVENLVDVTATPPVSEHYALMFPSSHLETGRPLWENHDTCYYSLAEESSEVAGGKGDDQSYCGVQGEE